MNANIEIILRDTGPMMSSELVKLIVETGVTPDAARQRVSRSRGPIRRLRGINFPNRESFLFLDDQFGKPEFQEKLAQSLQLTGSAYGRALTGLECRGGAMSSHLFPIATGLPTINAKGQLLHSIVQEKLGNLGLLSTISTPEGEMVCLWDKQGPDKRRQAVMLVEAILLSAVRNWLVKIGWSSTNALAMRGNDPPPKFGQFAWDIVGPCYLACMLFFEKGSLVHGFICADIILDRKVSLIDLRPFFSKLDCIRGQNRKQRLQPIIIAESFEPDALNELRRRGTLIAIPSILFGQELAADLRQLITTIENAAAAIANDSESVFRLLERVSKVEGAALNIRGVIIELIVGHLFKLEGYMIDIRQQVRGEDGLLAEIDVKANDRREIVCCECKGKSPNTLVDAPEIKKWLDETLPRIKYWLKQSNNLPDVRRFEFISSTGYTAAAATLIAQTTAAHKKQPIEFLDGEDIVCRLRAQKENSLVNIFREQFSPK